MTFPRLYWNFCTIQRKVCGNGLCVVREFHFKSPPSVPWSGSKMDGGLLGGRGAVSGRAAGIVCRRCTAADGRGWDGTGQRGALQGGQRAYAAAWRNCVLAATRSSRACVPWSGAGAGRATAAGRCVPRLGSVRLQALRLECGRSPFAPASLS